jgi:polyhydroxyalkanoate synthesis regulator phasin
MEKSTRTKVIAGAVAGVALAGGGAAIAATQLGSPKAESQAVINDAAKQLGVTPSALSDALKKALSDRVDAAVAAGRITKEQGDELKARIQSGEFPLFFGHPGFGHPGPFGGLDTTATYLGLTEDQVISQLQSGKTLAEIAQAQGKSVDGLIQAMTGAVQKRLDAAVAAGRITKEQEQSALADIKQRITDLVNGKMPVFRHRHPDGDFHGRPMFAGPMT